MQLHDFGVGEYLTNKYALWIDFRTTDENTLHGTGRKVGSEGGGITLQIEKKAESAGTLNAYIYVIMDAQLKTVKMKHLFLPYIRKMLMMKEPYTALFVAPTGVGKTHLALDLLK